MQYWFRFLLVVEILVLANINDYAQDIIGEISLSSESLTCQQKCIHHDNFHREVTRKDKWMIGDNYGPKITYFSPRKDYKTVDDGFRIKTIVEETGDENYPHKVVSGYLTNDCDVSVKKAFRFITTSSSLKEDFFLETSVPATGRFATLVCNYVDDNNYDAFEINVNRNNKVIISVNRTIGGVENTTSLLEISKPAKSVKIGWVNSNLVIYCGENDVTDEIPAAAKTVVDAFIIDKGRPKGIMVSNDRVYEYRVFDVYTFDTLRHIAVKDALAENGIHNGMHGVFPKDYSYLFLPTLKVMGIGSQLPKSGGRFPKGSVYANSGDGRIYENNGAVWVETKKRIGDFGMLYCQRDKRIYLCVEGHLIKQSRSKIIDFPDYVQRFEIRATDVKDTKTAHCEIAEKNDFSINNYNLRKRHVSFKTFLPVSFLEDDNKDGGEALIQFQISTDAGKTRQPLFAIVSKVKDEKVRYRLNRRYISTRPVPESAKWKEEILGDNDVDLGRARLGVWDQWEVYVKEGYMEEHCPLLVVKRNGKEVYRSNMPNTYNIMSGSYIRYGVYKSIYKYDDTPGRKRIVYIADFECDI